MPSPPWNFTSKGKGLSTPAVSSNQAVGMFVCFTKSLPLEIYTGVGKTRLTVIIQMNNTITINKNTRVHAVFGVPTTVPLLLPSPIRVPMCIYAYF